MASSIKATWEPRHDFGLNRAARRGCEYAAYLPDPLAGRTIVLDEDTAADVADAERALATLDAGAAALADSEAIARLLLRSESVASSKIEGLEIGGRRLLKAALGTRADEPFDVTALEVLGNIDAMRWAVDTVGVGREISVDDLREIHRRLLAGTRLEEHGGVVRTQQNWIGGSSFNPCSAAFVPPPPDQVEALLEDLCAFCNDDRLPPTAQAAIAHAQFETIHPFVDGNGRTGRALIHVVLRRRGLTTRVLAPVSLVLATWSDEYVAALGATRYPADPAAPEAIAGTNRWVALFAAAVRRAVVDAEAYQSTVAELREIWRERLGNPRAGSATSLLIDALPGAPLITAPGAAVLIGRSLQATNEAIARLVAGGVLHQTTAGRRNRAFEATELLDAFGTLERRLASPAGDTAVAPPARPTPPPRMSGSTKSPRPCCGRSAGSRARAALTRRGPPS